MPGFLFYDASTTEASTAAAFATPVGDRTKFDSLGWHTKLRDIDCENFRLADQSLIINVTLEDALSQCSGMPSYEQSSLVEFRYTEETPESYLQRLAGLPGVNSSKRRHFYTNLMYVVMSVLLYVLTG
jgi:CubicO group peptidase (beta-lactamase class C family)